MKGEIRYRGMKPRREWIADWVSNNDDLVRSMPIYVGGLSLLAVLFNRTVSGIAPVADASRLATLFEAAIGVLADFVFKQPLFFRLLLGFCELDLRVLTS